MTAARKPRYMRDVSPNRPKRPERLIPMAGDDNADFLAWWNACDACWHSDANLGCTAAGVTVHSKRPKYRGLPTMRGGCTRWKEKAHA